MIIRITDKTSHAFDNLIVPKLFYPVERDGHYCIGAVVEQGDVNTAAGILVFDVDDGISDGESMIVARLKWIYVADNFRNQGIGNSLMQEFFRVLDASGVYDIMCDVPFPEEYDDICTFLEGWDFVFNLTDVYDHTATIGEYLAKDVLEGKSPSKNIVPVNNLDKNDWNNTVKLLSDKYQYYDLSYDMGSYDNEVSCVWLDKDEVKGVMLVRLYGEKTLVPEVLKCFKGNEPAVVFNLIIYALLAAKEKYGEAAEVEVECTSDYVGNLIAYFFPDAQPLLVRRGIYVNDEMYDDIFDTED